ncbi:MAG TPA: hypothetical protein DDZ53_04835, partial [Firmicutes bacterium]|nr:hypothetical protein [Bacillota bacterium]
KIKRTYLTMKIKANNKSTNVDSFTADDKLVLQVYLLSLFSFEGTMSKLCLLRKSEVGSRRSERPRTISDF